MPPSELLIPLVCAVLGALAGRAYARRADRELSMPRRIRLFGSMYRQGGVSIAEASYDGSRPPKRVTYTYYPEEPDHG